MGYLRPWTAAPGQPGAHVPGINTVLAQMFVEEFSAHLRISSQCLPRLHFLGQRPAHVTSGHGTPHAPSRLRMGKGASGSGSRPGLGPSPAPPAGCGKGTSTLPSESQQAPPVTLGKATEGPGCRERVSPVCQSAAILAPQTLTNTRFYHCCNISQWIAFYVSQVWGSWAQGHQGLWGFSEDTVAAGRGRGMQASVPRKPEAGPALRLSLDTHSGSGACGRAALNS